MRRFAIALIALIIGVLPATALADEGDDRVHLALGDSVAAGTQAPDGFTDDGYVDVLYQRVRGPLGLTDLVNLACPGDDTGEFLDGNDTTFSPTGSLCYGDVTAPGFDFEADSQLAAALAYLGSNPGDVALITITIGANDVLGCQSNPATCTFPQGAFASIGANLPQIVGTLRAAVGPEVPIVAMNYYNPNQALYFTGGQAALDETNLLTTLGNGLLEQIYGIFDVSVADVASAFGTFDDRTNVIPRSVMLTCRYTAMCQRVDGQLTIADAPDIHPTDIGYRRIAWEFERTMKQVGLL